MPRYLYALVAALLLLPFCISAIGGNLPELANPDGTGAALRHAAFPEPLQAYAPVTGGVLETLKARAAVAPFNLAASGIFLLAILHTFACGFFSRLAHKFEQRHQAQLLRHEPQDSRWPEHVAEVSFGGTLLHFLGEVEVVFGLWVIVLGAAATHYYSWLDFKSYLSEDCRFTEPLFVVVIMALAASRPVLRVAEQVLARAAGLGRGSAAAWWLSVLMLAPVLGSFITEPAAMTIAALLLAKRFFPLKPSPRLAYATLGLLFVNISVGGTLTSFAAPPVLMVAGGWGWDTPFMLLHFGWKSLLGVGLSSFCYYIWFRKELRHLGAAPQIPATGATSDTLDFALAGGKPGILPMTEDSASSQSAHETTGWKPVVHERQDANPPTNRATLEAAPNPSWAQRETPIPGWVTTVHLGFLAWTVYAVHYPVLFIGGFLFFIAFVTATRHHQNSIALCSPILVGFFLAGLVIHGGCQGWWIEPIIMGLREQSLMLGASVLTAFNDNAAITYLAAQAGDISATAKYAVVAGAVAGGGLTVIANAPNPAGQSLLARFFKYGVSPLGLALGALPATVIIYLCLMLLPSGQPLERAPAPAEQHLAPASETPCPPPIPGRE
ncbi:MAG: putative Na+/H+ antiporter [Verrucomicrobiota bacterium]